MELKDFIKNIGEQFDEVEVSTLSSDTKFRELDEYSSIIALSIIAMIDEEYGVTLKGVDMSSAVTIQDLFEIVKKKISE